MYNVYIFSNNYYVIISISYLFRFGCFCGVTSGHVEKCGQSQFYLYSFVFILFTTGAKGKIFYFKNKILFFWETEKKTIFLGILRIYRKFIFRILAKRSSILETSWHTPMFTYIFNGFIVSIVSDFFYFRQFSKHMLLMFHSNIYADVIKPLKRMSS